MSKSHKTKPAADAADAAALLPHADHDAAANEPTVSPTPPTEPPSVDKRPAVPPAEAPPLRPPVPPAEAPPVKRGQNPLDGLTEGRVVHYVLENPADKGTLLHRPGIVVRVGNKDRGVCDLAVFVARSDFPKNANPGGMLQVVDAGYDDAGRPLGTWHFPERVS